MGFYHRVGTGETVRTIAETYGVSPDEIWGDPHNAELRRAGRHQDTLAEGDRVYIPDDEPPGTAVAMDGGTAARTGESHTFSAEQTQEIVIQFLDHLGRAASDRAYALDYDGRCYDNSGRTDADGILRVTLPLRIRTLGVRLSPPDPTAARARGSLDEFRYYGEIPQQFVAEFFIGDLDPPTADTRGLWQRLANLGYYDGPNEIPANACGVREAHCIEEFQRNFEIDASGTFDDTTTAKIAEVYTSSAARTFRPVRGLCLTRMDGPEERAIAPTERNTIRIPSALERMGMAGSGMFAMALRNHEGNLRYPVAQVAGVWDFFLVPFLSHGHAFNREDAYLRDLVAEAVTIVGWDWLPRPDDWQPHLEAAIAYTAGIGGRGWIVDAEKEWKNSAPNEPALRAIAWDQAEQYVTFARDACRRHGLWLGFTSYPNARGHHTLPYQTFVSRTDMSIPQTYDRDVHLDPHYVDDCFTDHLDHGATVLAAGVGFFRRDPPGANHSRARTGPELTAHLGTVPDYVESIVGWGPSTAQIRQVAHAWRREE